MMLEFENFQKILRLELSSNKLTSLSETMGNLPNLRILGLACNALDPGKPKTISELRQQWQEYQELSKNIKSARKT